MAFISFVLYSFASCSPDIDSKVYMSNVEISKILENCMSYDNMIPVSCKRCGSDDVTKYGHIRGKQRFRCKVCGYTFVVGDGRTTEEIMLKKAVLLLLHVMAGATFRKLGSLFNMCPSQVFRWVVKSGFTYPNQYMHGEISHASFDDVESVIQRKISHFDRSKPVVVAKGELMPGYPVLMLMQTPFGGEVKATESPFHPYRTLPYVRN